MSEPTQVMLQWVSGRIDAYPTRFELPTACRLARELSRCSPSIARTWVEAADGRRDLRRDCWTRPVRKAPRECAYGLI